MQIGCLLRLNSFWIGYHYSDEHKRLCINFIPCFTIWAVFGGGLIPRDTKLNFKIITTKAK